MVDKSLLFFIICAFSFKAFSAIEYVATVGDKKISIEEFNKRYQDIKENTLNPPTKEVFLEDLIRFEMGVLEAEKSNLKNDPVVAERIKQELYKGLIEKEIGDKVNDIKVSESEMKDYYKKNPELRTSHILIEIKVGANEQERSLAKKRAEEIFSEVKKSKRPFEELVGLYSDDVATKKSGGDIGWQTQITIVPEYYSAALKLKVGDLSGLFETKFGFHIIKLTGRHSYDDADKRKIRAAVFDQKRVEIFNQYFSKLKSKYSIKINKSLLK